MISAPRPHAFTVHSLRDCNGKEFRSWMHSPATTGRAVYEWVVMALKHEGYSEDEIDWCEADEFVPRDHARLRSTGEIVAVLHHRTIPATELLSTHPRAAKMLEAA
jgi:hypothetical protein